MTSFSSDFLRKLPQTWQIQIGNEKSQLISDIVNKISASAKKKIIPELEKRQPESYPYAERAERLEYLKKREEKISQVPKFGWGNIKQWIETNVPLFTKPIEKALKNEALTLYHFDEPAREIIKEIPLKEKLPKEAPWGAIIKEQKMPVGGAAGVYQGRVYPVARGIGTTVGKIFPQAIEKIPDWLEKEVIFKIYKKEKVLIGETKTATVAHEFLHGIFRRTDFTTNDFNKDWENEKKNNPDLIYIDDMLQNHPIYKGIQDNPFGIADERFAHLGALLGQGGKKMFPFSLRKYYEGVFK